MDSTALAYNCPNCGAQLYYNADKQKLCCEFCLSEFTESEILETDAKARAEQQELDSKEYCEHMNEYECPNCGGQFACEENTVSGVCVYCYSPVILKGKLSGQMKPDKIVPFKYGKEEAANKFLEFARKRWFVPKEFKSKLHADKITGTYFPFWVTDADTNSSLEADATKVRVWRSGNTEYRETSKYKVERGGYIHFEDIVSSAISSEDKDMLEGILPYPSSALEDFSMPYLSGFTSKKRDINREALSNEVKTRMVGYAETLLRNTIYGYATVSKNKLNVNVSASHWDYSLMPVWMLNYNTKKKTYKYAMNGFTGKIYGELPVSVNRLILAFSGVFASVFAIVAAIGGMFW